MPGLPEESFIVRVYFNPPEQGAFAPHLATTFSVYGRGVGSRAREKPRIYIPIGEKLFKACGRKQGNVLVLMAETAAGDPVEAELLRFSPPSIEPY
jgi:hypothetical protein